MTELYVVDGVSSVWVKSEMGAVDEELLLTSKVVAE